MDVDITAGSGTSNNVAAGFATGQDLNYAAVSAEFAQINDPTAVAAPSEPAGASETGTAPSASASTTGGAASSEAGQPTSAGPTANGPPSPATQTTFTVQATSAPGEESCINHMPTTTLTMTLATVPGASTETFTQYASVTETVFQTVYPSGFDKRSRKLRKGPSSGTGQQANVEIDQVTQIIVDSSPSASPYTSREFQLRGRGRRLVGW